MVILPSILGVPSSTCSSARPSRAAGGPPCWASLLHGPAVAAVEAKTSSPRGS